MIKKVFKIRTRYSIEDKAFILEWSYCYWPFTSWVPIINHTFIDNYSDEVNYLPAGYLSKQSAIRDAKKEYNKALYCRRNFLIHQYEAKRLLNNRKIAKKFNRISNDGTPLIPDDKPTLIDL